MNDQQPSQSQPKRSPVRQSFNGGGKKTMAVIASLIGIAALLLIVNAVVKKDEDGDNGNQNVAVTNTNQPAIITSNVDTSDWKTYRNEELGFEVKYPKTWRYVVTESGQAEFYDSQKVNYLEGSETYLVSVFATKLGNDFSFEDWMNGFSQARKSYGGDVKNVKINDMDAVQGTDYSGVQTVLHLNGYRYYVNHVPVDFDIDDTYRAMLLSWRLVGKEDRK